MILKIILILILFYRYLQLSLSQNRQQHPDRWTTAIAAMPLPLATWMEQMDLTSVLITLNPQKLPSWETLFGACKQLSNSEIAFAKRHVNQHRLSALTPDLLDCTRIMCCRSTWPQPDNPSIMCLHNWFTR
jgi:hypothetical protein